MPFTLRNLKEDLEDLGPKFDGAPDLEFRLATKALELEKSGLSYQRVPPGTWRGCEAGPDGLEILVIGAPNLGENPRDDVEGVRLQLSPGVEPPEPPPGRRLHGRQSGPPGSGPFDPPHRAEPDRFAAALRSLWSRADADA